MPRILVVDDDKMITGLLREALEFFGHSVVVSNNPLEALMMSLNEDYRVIILDLEMPELDGRGFLKSLRKAGKSKTRVILHTGHVDDENFPELKKLGADYILKKPSALGEILETVKEALAD
jgi:DNA-binding response OmpR family regulator